MGGCVGGWVGGSVGGWVGSRNMRRVDHIKIISNDCDYKMEPEGEIYTRKSRNENDCTDLWGHKLTSIPICADEKDGRWLVRNWISILLYIYVCVDTFVHMDGKEPLM